MSLQQGTLDLNALRGTVAVITGAGNKGIGWGLAKRCAELGMSVAVLDLHEALVTSAAAELATLGCTCVGLVCNVADAASVDRCKKAVHDAFPRRRIGAVFANAGVYFASSFVRSSLDDWKTTLDVNVLGVVHTFRAFLPSMIASHEPSIICATSSIGGILRGDSQIGMYQASKHAVTVLCESLSFEMARRNPQACHIVVFDFLEWVAFGGLTAGCTKLRLRTI